MQIVSPARRGGGARTPLDSTRDELRRLTSAMAHSPYKVLIVDDEQIIRRGLENVIDWDEVGFEVAGTAANGLTALQIIERSDIDVVIVDIKMPQFDGLELSRHLFEHFPRIRIVILSGYADFRYAQETIDYRVYAYLLKPSRTKDIRELFLRLRDELDGERRREDLSSRGRDIETAETLAKLCRALPVEPVSISPFAGRLAFTIMVCECVRDFSAPESFDEDAAVTRSLYDDLHGRVAEHYDDDGDLFPYVDPDNLLCVLLTEPSDAARARAEDVFGFLRSTPALAGRFGLSAGLGDTVDDIGRLHASFATGRRLLARRITLGTGLLIQGPLPMDEGPLPFTFDLGKAAGDLLDAVRGKRLDDTSRLLDHFIGSLRDHRVHDEAGFHACLAELIVAARETALRREWTLELPIHLGGLLAMIPHLKTFEDARHFLDHLFRAARAEAPGTDLEPGNNLIRMALRLIDSDLGRLHSLASISSALNISPAYFSSLFKREIGLNFKDYLLTRRIRKAQALLRNTEYKVYEIAESVGFHDAHYFSEVFRKQTGFHPSDYRTGRAPR
jgi:two-component system, response regulator YesN